MTAVQWLVDKLTVEVGTHRLIRSDLTSNQVRQAVEEAKEMEKQQAIEFAEFVASYPNKNKNYLGGMLHAKSKYDGAEQTVDLLEQYYNETYGSEIGSSLEWNGEVTQGHGVPASSQTEISDEEIQKAAESQATFAPSFIRGVEWYREQLKQRQ